MSVEDFDTDWKIDWVKRVIYCDSPSPKKKYTVTDFCRWIREEEASEEGRVFPTILQSDGMGSGFNTARKVRLINNYAIGLGSLKHLVGTDTTLLDDKKNVLVPDSLSKKPWWENGIVQGVLVIIAIVSLIVALKDEI